MKQLYIRRAFKKKKRAPKRLKRLLYPERVEAEYRKQLEDILGFIRARVEAKIKPILPALVAHYGRDRKDSDEDLGDLADLLEGIRIETSQRFTDEELKRLAKLTGKSVEEWNAKQMNGQLESIIEIDLLGNEPWLAREMGAFVVQNVGLIKSIESEYLDQVQSLVATSVRSGLRVEEIAAEIDDRFDVSASRARLIARDQVGKFNGQLTETRQKDLGVEEYTWRGVGDARERDSHRLLNNTRQRWDDPPEVGHPGEDIQCRCWAEPVLDQFYGDES